MVDAPQDWAGGAFKCPQCEERETAIPEDSKPAKRTSGPNIENDLRVYRLAMRFLGVVLILVGAGLVVFQVKAVVRAQEVGALRAIAPHLVALVLFAVLYISLGVLAIRLYSWTTYALTALFSLMFLYSLIQQLTSRSVKAPEAMWAGIGLTAAIAAFALIALLAAFKARRLKAAGYGYAGRGGLRAAGRAGIGIVVAIALLWGAAFTYSSVVEVRGGKRKTGRKPVKAEWRRIDVRKGVFSVEMPGKPKSSTHSVAVPQGSIKIHTYELVTKRVNYAAAYSEYPQGFLASVGGSADALFDRARDATVAKFAAELVRDEKGMLGRFPERIVVMRLLIPKTPVRATMKHTMVLAKGRMYFTQSLMTVEGDKEAADDAERLHRSFRLSLE